MNEKIKEFLKKYFIGFIIGVITTFSISVIAATYFPSKDVTYDNKESGLESQNVQGAIDELYGICTAVPAGDQIIATSNLEKDPYECRYFFTGENPNNYITFNGEKAGWRIISVECDGTIKIMKIADINTSDNLAWDSTASNNWARPATLNTYLNSTYLSALSSEAQSQIVAKDFSIGTITLNNDLESQINEENETTWNGKIALPTLSEYLRTNSSASCKTYESYYNYSITCKNTTWMYQSGLEWWTLTPYSYSNVSRDAFSVLGAYGDLSASNANDTFTAVRPVVYLNSNIKKSGSGTQSNPYTIE